MQPVDKQIHPYQRRDALLSRGELAFYTVLRRALRGAYGISIKTRLADIVKVPADLWNSPPGRRLSQKHVDFLLYDRGTTRIIAVVELDDRTHDTADRRRRDRFMDEVLDFVGVPIYRIRTSAKYSVNDLRNTFTAVISTETHLCIKETMADTDDVR